MVKQKFGDFRYIINLGNFFEPFYTECTSLTENLTKVKYTFSCYEPLCTNETTWFWFRLVSLFLGNKSFPFIYLTLFKN